MPASPQLEIIPAQSPEDLEAIKHLFRAYAEWLNIDLAYQGFEEELAGLPGKYAPPGGSLLLARNATGTAIGCVGLRPINPAGVCEMKRLYVLPEGRGLGLGEKLVAAIIGAAESAGYTEMRLDTLPTMAGALGLYEKHGFEPMDRYYETPISETLFFRRWLVSKQ